MALKENLGVGSSVTTPEQRSRMQNNNFFSKSPLPSPSNLPLIAKNSPSVPPLEDQEYSNNVLNIGFIAEGSKWERSESCSEHSDGISISAVSAIHSNPKDRLRGRLEQEFVSISGMSQWSQPSENPFKSYKRSFKRSKPQSFYDESEEYQDQMCTKKKMGDRNKILTINSLKQGRQRSYMLRSKTKLIEEESSSNDDIRQILYDFENQENGALPKNKSNK